MRKILAVCEGGNVRSVGLAWTLKDNGVDAVAASLRYNSEETLNMLFEWADSIVVMQFQMKARIPEAYWHKLHVLDVGPDRYGSPYHPELQAKIHGYILEWAEKDFVL